MFDEEPESEIKQTKKKPIEKRFKEQGYFPTTKSYNKKQKLQDAIKRGSICYHPPKYVEIKKADFIFIPICGICGKKIPKRDIDQ